METRRAKAVRRRLNRLWARGDDEGQLPVASEYVRKEPGDVHGWALWGNTLFRLGRFSEAEAVLGEALELLRHADPDIGWLLAKALSHQGKTAEAKELLTEQKHISPSSRLPFLGLAEVALQEGENEQAKSLLREALDRTPDDDPGAFYETALILLAMPTGKEQAEGLLRKAVAGMPNHSLSHLLLGALLEHENPPVADALIQKARRLWRAPTDFDVMLQHTRELVARSQGGDSD